MTQVVDRFMRYLAFDTQSDGTSKAQPSSEGQAVFIRLLVDELKSLGIADAAIDRHGYATATIPANIARKVPVLGFLAHVDTAPDMSGANVKPQLVDYCGQDIILNQEHNLVMGLADFPELEAYRGETLITTDGTTLLGADDKAGVAEIMQVTEYLVRHPEVPHGTLKIAFTVDEEIGRGVDFFDIDAFGADYAYTIDGGAIGELEYENFNAASATITIVGRNIHPGYAKNKMLNAASIAMEMHAMLPPSERPEHTEGYEGFYHLSNMTGTVEQATLNYLIRDHDMQRFEQRKQYLQHCADLLNLRYGASVVQMRLKDWYFNMKPYIEPHPEVVERACRAMQQAGVVPSIQPIRGGTDGARLSCKGLLCPNLFTGGHNFHGRYEFIPVKSMQKACEVILNLIKIYASEQ
ncbi:MAG: peptidase T [Prevotellaceae bacterium]|jgi:tripeptide aminopeptidase|nr:peptidase T [Prevotellaceae bacterium]